MNISNTIGRINSAIAAHSVLTTGVHGAGEDHLALFGEASQLLSKVVWKDVSEQAVSDANRTTELNWTDLDLTAYISANAKFAILQLHLYATVTGTGYGCYLFVRKNGTTPTYVPQLIVLYAFPNYTTLLSVVIVALDDDKVIEYKLKPATGATFTSYINVLGYIE